GRWKGRGLRWGERWAARRPDTPGGPDEAPPRDTPTPGGGPPMAGNPQVLGLLEEMIDSGKTPEEMCRHCPELLPEVRRRWQEFCLIDAEVVALLPELRTAADAGPIMPGPPAAGLPQVPGSAL